MPTKLKIKMGHVEFEYEGDAPYDTDAVKDLFTHIESLMGAAPAGAFDAPTPPRITDSAPASNGDLASLSVHTVAARLNVKSGPELALAAAAHLQVCQQKRSFSRKELLTSMQDSKAYYNQNMSKNLSNMLGRMTKDGQLNSLANDEWSLTAAEMKKASEILDQSR